MGEEAEGVPDVTAPPTGHQTDQMLLSNFLQTIVFLNVQIFTSSEIFQCNRAIIACLKLVVEFAL